MPVASILSSKLRPGDFIFYFVLVGRSVMYYSIFIISRSIGIMPGVIETLVWLTTRHLTALCTPSAFYALSGTARPLRL